MKSLAQELGVSYSWFRSTFTAHTGLSPHQYLLELRIVRARSLLTEAEFSVKERKALRALRLGHLMQYARQRNCRGGPSGMRATTSAASGRGSSRRGRGAVAPFTQASDE